MNRFKNHYEESTFISAKPEVIFTFADKHKNFSSHMNKSSWMMGGGKMETTVDNGKGQKIGSHIEMKGKVFGFNLFLDEVITVYDPPSKKAWETVGDINLIVIGHYALGFQITENKNGSLFKVFIDYELPEKNRGFGKLFGGFYAKWCVKQMIEGVQNHFSKTIAERG